MQKVVGIQVEPGKQLPSYFLLSNCGTLADRSRDVCEDIRGFLDFHDCDAWDRRQLPVILEVFGQFFGTPKARHWPGIVWALPFYIPIEERLSSQNINPINRILAHTNLCPADRPIHKLNMGFGLCEPEVTVNLRRLLFSHPRQRERCVGFWQTISEHSGELPNRRRMVSTLAQAIGLRGPEDELLWRERGSYPAHGDQLAFDASTGKMFMKSRALILTRVRPRVSWCHGWMHQVVIPLDPVSGRINDFNTFQRDFGTFFPDFADWMGAKALLQKSVRQEGVR